MAWEFVLAGDNVPEKVRTFIYEYIDSVEQLEILLLLHHDCNKRWSAMSISQQLRSSPNSAEKRLQLLKSLNLAQVFVGATVEYQCVTTPDITELIAELDRAYKIQPHRILELIFSPTKKARNFADSFRLYGNKKNPGGKK